MSRQIHFFFFFFNDTATTEIYTLSLHDALPISRVNRNKEKFRWADYINVDFGGTWGWSRNVERSEEHTSELQSRLHLVCRLLLEKKKNIEQQTSDLMQHINILAHDGLTTEILAT